MANGSNEASEGSDSLDELASPTELPARGRLTAPPELLFCPAVRAGKAFVRQLGPKNGGGIKGREPVSADSVLAGMGSGGAISTRTGLSGLIGPDAELSDAIGLDAIGLDAINRVPTEGRGATGCDMKCDEVA